MARPYVERWTYLTGGCYPVEARGPPTVKDLYSRGDFVTGAPVCCSTKARPVEDEDPTVDEIRLRLERVGKTIDLLAKRRRR